MCGIGAYIGNKNAYEYLIYTLLMLQNRGYDSAGICTINNTQQFILRKYASQPEISAVKRLEGLEKVFENSTIGITHSRWRTTGGKTDENAHPHIDYTNKFVLVHNGIIENYSILKNDLLQNGVIFNSETDTEVIVNMIGYYYKESGNVKDAIQKTLNKIEGTYGLVILCLDTPNTVYCVRHGSPLLIGFSDSYAMIASEQSGFCKYVDNYICLNDNDLVILEKHGNKISFEKLHEYQLKEVTVEETSYSPAPYPHWTIKEIFEQYDASIRAMGMGGRIANDREVKLGGLSSHVDDLIDIEHLIILGCGTSLHSGMYVLDTFRQICGFNTVQIFDGAEFTKYNIPTKGKTGLILLSQSGETKDLHRCVEIGKDLDLMMIGVINVVDSLIARDVHCGVYLNAGREVAVASTKAFTSQVIVLNMIAVWFAQNRNINPHKRIAIIRDLRRLPIDIKNTISSTYNSCKTIAQYLKNKHSLFILGKGNCESVAKEGALKIKEIGYINGNGYNSSALKHGPYSLLEEGTPVICLNINDEHHKINNGVIEELLSRDAFVISISDIEIDKTTNIKVPNNITFRGLLTVIPQQIIAYELGISKDINVDQPRGLAKVCTVD